jgi:hypothetical protein
VRQALGRTPGARRALAAVLFACVFALGLAAALALTAPPSHAAPPTPTYGTAVVDGNDGEWDLSNDFYSPMYNAFQDDPTAGNYKVLGDGYLRYDCATGTVFVLVLTSDPSIPVLVSPSGNAWASIGGIHGKVYTDGSGDDGTPPDFHWIGQGDDGNSAHAQGYEASFSLAPGSYTIVVHVESSYNGGATAGFPNGSGTGAVVSLTIPDSCSNTPPSSTTSTTTTTTDSTTTTTDSTTTTTTATTTTTDSTTTDSTTTTTTTAGTTTSPSTTTDTTTTDTTTTTTTTPASTTGTTTTTTGETTTTPSTTSAPAGGNEGPNVQDITISLLGAHGSANGVVGDPVTASYQRVYEWRLTKTPRERSRRSAAKTTVFHYAVTVEETGFRDSGWTLDGEIQLSNPNAFDLQNVTITDAVDNGGVCTVANGVGVTLPASKRYDLSYHCTYDGAPRSLSGVDTVTARWDAAANGTPDGSAEAQTPFTFGAPTDAPTRRVVVLDSVGRLGVVSARPTRPFVKRTFRYGQPVRLPAAGCRRYANTVLIRPIRRGTAAVRGQKTLKTVTRYVEGCEAGPARPAVGRDGFGFTG